MDFDVGCLRRAKRENVERLARAIGAELPRPSMRSERMPGDMPTLYDERLFQSVLRTLRRQTAAEELSRLLGI
jgi:hypothetical protein